MSYNKNLQKPLNLKELKLKNRVIMGSLTRNRGIVPNEANAEYYAQRASCGLIISEGILIEPQGLEWIKSPGIWDDEQTQAWKKVTQEVHKNNGLIFGQMWHLGRAANEIQNRGIPPPAPSAIQAKGGKFRELVGTPGYTKPKAIVDPKEYVIMFKNAAIRAKEAGFDGIELMAGNGFLPHQFLESHSNIRTDIYGGSIENRARFTLEIIDEFIKVFTAGRVGIKISPCGGYNDMGESTEEEAYALYSYLIKELDRRNIAYIQIIRRIMDFDYFKRGLDLDVQKFSPLIKNSAIFLNAGFTAEEGDKFIAEGKADAIVYSRPYIANPDLSERFFNNYELAEITDYSTVNGYHADLYIGLTDYPRYSKS